MKKIVFSVVAILISFSGFSQKERGKFLKKPNITPNQTNSDVKSKNFNSSTKEDDDFTFEDEPRLRFANSFETEKKVESSQGTTSTNPLKIEPIKELNNTIHEDTSTIDEGQLEVIEIEEEAQFAGSEEMVKIASYFSVWDTGTIDPYGIDAKDFEDVLPLKLYDLSEGRYWAAPLTKCPTTSNFGWRWRRWHTGIDLDLDTGDPVFTAFDGIIRFSGWSSGYGRCMVVRHYNGLETLYGHLSKSNFESNTIVKAGDEIGKGGSTGRSSGPHLHFETRYEGNPFDPTNIFTFAKENSTINSDVFMLSPNVYDYLRGGVSKSSFEFEEEQPVKVATKVWTRVHSGDTLTEIAHRYKTSVPNLCRLNKIRSSTKLYSGMRLRVK